MNAVLLVLPVLMLTPLVVHERGEPPAPVPVLLLTGQCDCPPTVVPSNLGTLSTCTYGSSTEPCFTVGTTSNDDDQEDTPGTCIIAPNCTTASSCTFVARKVTFTAAPCIKNGSCGAGPWQLYDTQGNPIDAPITDAGEQAEVVISIANQACRSFHDYVVQMQDKIHTPIVRYNVRAQCGKCQADQIPYNPPPPE